MNLPSDVPIEETPQNVCEQLVQLLAAFQSGLAPGGVLFPFFLFPAFPALPSLVLDVHVLPVLAPPVLSAASQVPVLLESAVPCTRM